MRRSSASWLTAALAIAAGAGCGNNPYPDADAGTKTYYGYLLQSYILDPVRTQNPTALGYLGAVCETLFEYDYLKRPLVLRPLLARSVPTLEPVAHPEGGASPGDAAHEKYLLRLEIWDGVLFHRDVCFDEPAHASPKTRELTAEDFEFTLMRIADPLNNCPAYDAFARIEGLQDWSARIAAVRKAWAERSPPRDPTPSIRALYRQAGPIAGVRVTGRYALTLQLREKYPILLYWLASTLSAPTPPEAVEYYDGRDGRRHLREWPIGTGPYRMAAHDLDEFLALEKNPDWRGITQPQRRLPGTTYPTEGEAGDAAAGLLRPEYAGRPLPFIDRFEYRRDVEPVSRFAKFLQGYYDAEEVYEETFNQALAGGILTPALAARGIDLNIQTEMRIWYFAFNMDDDIVGAPAMFRDPAREKDRDLWIDRNRKLRQAMSLAFDTRREIEIFRNGRATKAESPLPPGVFGYDPAYRNPFRQYDPGLTQARQLLAEAGYPGGIDPRTRAPLRIVMSTDVGTSRDWELYRMCAQQFGRLGIDLEIETVTYNAFVQKMNRGAFQFLRWGWFADYPDPQTFLLLLYGPESTADAGGGNNKARFQNARYDFLYDRMIRLRDDESATWTETAPDGRPRAVTMTRGEIIREMIRIVEHECPWILNHHPQTYALYHDWYHNVKPNTVIYNVHKYRDIDAGRRAAKREAWNRPVLWPAFAITAGLLLLVAPAVRAYLRRTRR